MKLQHIAFWTTDLDRITSFYKKHFQGKTLFCHSDGDFSCEFIKICDITIEFMTNSRIKAVERAESVGYSHFSIEVDEKAQVDRLTEYFQKEGLPFEKMKEQYEDGFYESSIVDPDGNIIEIAYIDRAVNPHV